MNKHDEGYVLAYVTVVLLLFCLIATMILTGAMKNLTNQQDAIARMEDQYAAAGMIEQVVANMGKIEDSDYLEAIGVSCEKNENDNYVLTARHESVEITCEITPAGKYISYEISTATTVPNEDGGVAE